MMHRGGDPERVTPDTTDIESKYLPEARTSCFDLPAYWIDASHVSTFVSGGEADTSKLVLFSSRAGRKRVLFFVHPLAASFYAEFLRDSRGEKAFPPGAGYLASPTASTRTVLAWRPGAEGRAFLVKLSLPFSIGGASRTLGPEAVSRSVGVSMILEGSSSDLPANFGFLRESIGVVPKVAGGAGFLIRAVPEALLHGEVRYVPMFALYSRQSSGIPWVVRLIASSGMNALDFLRDRLLAPFADHWCDLVTRNGLIPEPHAQNLLVAMDKHDRLLDQFVHRDLENFYVDLAHRRRTRQFVPSNLPATSPINANYEQRRLLHRAVNSVYRYFMGTIVYELDRLLRTYPDRHLRAGEIAPVDLETTFIHELERALSVRAGRRVNLGQKREPDRLKRAIIDCRSRFTASLQCSSPLRAVVGARSSAP